jgi:hypothetical protein
MSLLEDGRVVIKYFFFVQIEHQGAEGKAYNGDSREAAVSSKLDAPVKPGDHLRDDQWLSNPEEGCAALAQYTELAEGDDPKSRYPIGDDTELNHWRTKCPFAGL